MANGTFKMGLGDGPWDREFILDYCGGANIISGIHKSVELFRAV
jgi:hypothetical protein